MLRRDGESLPLLQFLYLSQFPSPEKSLGRPGPFEEEAFSFLQALTVNIPPNLPQRDLGPLTRVAVYWGKGHTQTGQGSLCTGSE